MTHALLTYYSVIEKHYDNLFKFSNSFYKKDLHIVYTPFGYITHDYSYY